MTPFHSRCPEVAARETRSLIILKDQGLPPGEYAFLELYCADPACDCRRVFIEVVARDRPGVLASINFGWESYDFYRKKMPYDPAAPREITCGSLDPLNEQSELAPELLRLFQTVVADEPYRIRLKRHHKLFRSTLKA